MKTIRVEFEVSERLREGLELYADEDTLARYPDYFSGIGETKSDAVALALIEILEGEK